MAPAPSWGGWGLRARPGVLSRWSPQPPGQGRARLGPASGGGNGAENRRVARWPGGFVRSCSSEPGPLRRAAVAQAGSLPRQPRESAQPGTQTPVRRAPYPSHFYFGLPSFLERKDPGWNRTSPNAPPPTTTTSAPFPSAPAPSRSIPPSLGRRFLSGNSRGVERREGCGWAGARTPALEDPPGVHVGRGLGGLLSRPTLGTHGDPWCPPPQTLIHAPSEREPRRGPSCGRAERDLGEMAGWGPFSYPGGGIWCLGSEDVAIASPRNLKPCISLRPSQPTGSEGGRGREPLLPQPQAAAKLCSRTPGCRRLRL